MKGINLLEERKAHKLLSVKKKSGESNREYMCLL